MSRISARCYARFVIRLPPISCTPLRDDARVRDDKAVMGKNLTVLVMDDAAVVRNLLVAMLGELETVSSVIQAEDASSALDMIEEHEPEVAILDVKVPGNGTIRNGIDVLRRVKKFRPDTSVIMLTNHASTRYRTECEQAGAD